MRDHFLKRGGRRPKKKRRRAEKNEKQIIITNIYIIIIHDKNYISINKNFTFNLYIYITSCC